MVPSRPEYPGYTREQLERVVVAHVNEKLVPGGSPSLSFDLDAFGCANQHAFKVSNQTKAWNKFPRAAQWFDRNYHPGRLDRLDGVEFERAIRSAGLVQEGEGA